MQTFIDRYIEQGRQQGLSLGREEGQQEGWQKGQMEERRRMLFHLLARKFGTLTPAQQRQVKQADSETLLRWADQVLFAATAEDALR